MLGKSKSMLVLGSGIDMDEVQKRINPQNIKKLYRDFKLNGKVCVSMVSRLVKSKGVIEFLKAAREIKKRTDKVEFYLEDQLKAKEGKRFQEI